jgi:hypothetical protein
LASTPSVPLNFLGLTFISAIIWKINTPPMDCQPSLPMKNLGKHIENRLQNNF